MPHLRERHALPLLLKKLSFSPVVTIQGVRQAGKSYLAREVLHPKIRKSCYATLDKKSDRDFANTNPETFLLQRREFSTIIIDEAQKAPDLFDAIKYEVDKKRIPGKYLLLGSTEFSKMTLIRESLTGRMSRVRLYPLNLAETLSKKMNSSSSPLLINEKSRFSREELLVYLSRGGMPGMFAVRSESERESLIKDWLELTTARDILTFKTIKADQDLCYAILEQIAVLEEPIAANISRVLRKDSRRIQTYLKMLTELFVIHPLPAHPTGTGKTQYFLCDVAIARELGANFERQLYTWIVLEQLSQRAYRDDRDNGLYYYKSTKGSIIHLVVQDKAKKLHALKLFPMEGLDKRELFILKSYAEKCPAVITTAGLGASTMKNIENNISIFNWESIG